MRLAIDAGLHPYQLRDHLRRVTRLAESNGAEELAQNHFRGVEEMLRTAAEHRRDAGELPDND
jgi:hypothetical protein